MRIGMVTTQFAEVGGVENVVRNLAREMKAEGHEVELITRSRPQNTNGFSEFNKVNIIEDTESYLDYLRKGRKWFRRNQNRFDVLHFHNWSPILPARNLDTKTVLTYHGTTLDVALGNEQYLKSPIYWALEQYALTIPDEVTSITESHLEPFYIKNYDIIRNGVDTEKYRPPENKEELRKKYDIEGKGILIVAQHEPNKGHEKLIKAVSDLDQEYTLMIPSTGSLREELEELAEQEKVNANFYGKVPEKELIELYQSADLFCLPSWNEGLPLSMLEALSCGLPILVSEVADNREIVEESRAGGLLDTINEYSLLRELDKNLNDLNGEGFNARNYMLENLDWSNISSEYLRVYRRKGLE